MRMKIITEDRTLRDAANEFLAFKRAQKLRERTLKDYKKYIDAYPNGYKVSRRPHYSIAECL